MNKLSPGKAVGVGILRVLVLSVTGFVRDKCSLKAASLTFYSLLSIVPAVALALGIAKGFGVEKLLNRQIMEAFPGQVEVRDKIIQFSNSLIENTQGGMIAGVGILILFWTVLRVLMSIESSLNDIWKVKKSRPFVRKFSDYFSIMLIAPVLVILSSSTTIYITAAITDMTDQIVLLGYLGPVIFFLMKVIPYLLIWLLFTLIYTLVPNTKVNPRSAFIAGVVAGTVYQLTQWGYINFQVGVAKYNAVYGSLAALPLFLVWLHVSWLIVLFGAEMAFASQNVHRIKAESDYQGLSPFLENLISLRIAHLIMKNFSAGTPPLTEDQIADRLEMPVSLIQRKLNTLVESGLFTEFRFAESDELVFQPARDIHSLSVNDVLNALVHNGTDTLPVAQSGEWKTLRETLQVLNREGSQSTSNRLLKDL